ncbi:hypothetical protein BH11MYX3_BH11MYX3_08230 [soil metagenome]
MDPYRTSYPTLVPSDVELDRLPVSLRIARLRVGSLVVTPSMLTFEPRAGRSRAVPISAGLVELRIPFVLRTAPQTIASWQRIVDSPPYQQPLAAEPHRTILRPAFGHTFGGGVQEQRTFVPIIDGDQLLVIEAAPSFDSCFAQRSPALWPDSSARLLGRALSWLGRDELTRVLGLIRLEADRCRVFTRAEVRARPSYAVENRRFHLLGHNARDAIALEPTRAELAMLDEWAAVQDR